MNTDTDLILRDPYRVTSWDAEPRGRLAPAALGRFLQETALNHADALGFGVADLGREGMTWVLGSLLVRVERYPDFQQDLVLETWPRGVDGLKALREFRLLDQRGAELAAASGAYLIIDLVKRRAIKLDRFYEREWRGVRALDRDPGKIPALAGPAMEREVELRWSDIDLLGHITNTRYLELALENYEKGFLMSHEIAEMEMNFLAEGTYPGSLLCRQVAVPDAPHTFIHSLARSGEGKELYRARLKWRAV